jgi:cell division protein FtsQ
VNTKRIIQRIVFITLTLVACSGLVILLVAAIGKKNKEQCRDYVITIKGTQSNQFIDVKDVIKLVTMASRGRIKGQPISFFNLRKLEQLLKDNVWIRDAELYFDNQDVLHISVLEREPIARIFTTSGNSFYIDSSEKQMPLSDKLSARVPVFTNFPERKLMGKRDSSLMNDVKKTASFIMNDPFWMSQVEQIDISECGYNCWGFEMVPTIGNHTVRLGNGDDIDKKFHRLFVFYRQVMSKTGFDRYNVVDVQYDGQVIGSKVKMNKVDSLQLKLNVQKLLKQSQEMQKDIQAIPLEKPANNLEQQAASQTAAVKEQTTINPKPSKTVSTTKSNTKPKLIKQPKAVMKKRDDR